MATELHQPKLRLAITAPIQLLASDGPGERQIDVICSTESVNDYGFKILQSESTWDLTRYQANPVVLYGHNASASVFGGHDPRNTLPIGRAENMRVENGALRCTIRFASAEANPLAEQVYRLMSEGILSAVSVGFDPVDDSVDAGEDDVPVIKKAVLYELSVVPIGADPGAVRASNSMALMQLAAPRRGATETAMIDEKNMKLAADDSEAPAPEPADAPPSDAGDAGSKDPMQACMDACEALEQAADACAAACHAVEDMPDASDECKAACEAVRASAAQAKADAEACEAACADAMGSSAPSEEMDPDDKSPAAELARKLRSELARVKSELRAHQVKDSNAAKFGEIDKLVLHAKRDGKMTPALEREVRKVAGLSLSAAKALVAALPKIAALTSPKVAPARKSATGDLSYNGKGYGELSFSEKHDLAVEDPDLFAAMRVAHEAAQRA
jgi:HK97 family phage prohead protease